MGGHDGVQIERQKVVVVVRVHPKRTAASVNAEREAAIRGKSSRFLYTYF